MQYRYHIFTSNGRGEFSFTGRLRATRVPSPLDNIGYYDIGRASVHGGFMYVTVTVNKIETVYRCDLTRNSWTKIHEQDRAGGSHQGRQSTFIWNNRYYSIAGYTHTKSFYIPLDNPSLGRQFLPDTPVYAFSGGNTILLSDTVFYGGFPTDYNVRSPIHYLDLNNPTQWHSDYSILNQTGVLSFHLLGHNGKGYIPRYGYRVTSNSTRNYEFWTEFDVNRSVRNMTFPSSNISSLAHAHTASCSVGDWIILVRNGKVFAYDPITSEEIHFGNLPFSPVYHSIVPHNGKVYMVTDNRHTANTGYSGFWELVL